jgi:arylsulfatase
VVGDNGGSAEGGLEGSDINLATFGGGKSDLATMLSHIDDLGSPYYDNHYAAGWPWATTAPFQWMKQIASHFGGTRDGFVVNWPGDTAAPQAVRTQFAHVNDIAPTIYQAAGITFPDEVDGTKQLPLEGRSLVPTFTDPSAKTGHDEQYFEIFGNRAIYKDGWVAGAWRYAPWELFANPLKVFAGDPAKDKWELYHVAEDFSEAHDLAASNPQKLDELKREFDSEAQRNGVYPLVPIPLVGIPSPVTGRTHFVYGEGVDRIPLAVTPDLTARAHRLTAEIDVPAQGGDGVIVAERGRFGGFSLYVSGGKLIYENNTFGTVHERIVSNVPLPVGHATITFDFTPDPRGSLIGALLRKVPGSGLASLKLNGQKLGETHFTKFGGFASSIDEALDIGRDSGSPVSTAYQSPNPYSGRVTRVTIDLL